MDTISFKEKQKMFQKKAEKDTLKLKEENINNNTSNTIDRTKIKKIINNNEGNDSIKSNLILKLANDLENKQKIKKEKSLDKINSNDIKNDNKNEIKENVENKHRGSKDNIYKIKIQVEELLNKKEKIKNNDKKIKKNREESNSENNLEQIDNNIKNIEKSNIKKKQSIDINENKYIERYSNRLFNNNENIINKENIEDDNDNFSNKIDSNNEIIEIKKEKKDNSNILKNRENNIIHNNKKNLIKQKNLSDLDVDDFQDFKEEYYSDRKYDKTNIDKGKLFFKYRYLKNKYNQINETIQQLTTQNYKNKDNEKEKSINILNNKDNNDDNNNNIIIQKKYSNINQINNKFTLSNNVYLSYFIKNPSSQCLNIIDKDSELRHYHSIFLKKVENSILYFNLKNYEESYLYLYMNGIIKNLEEFGEFLLVGNGFDKFIIGEFLSKKEIPNDKKEVLKGFINAIKMNYEEISFLECFRFFMKRFYLPKDSNLILEIMNNFCLTYFESNKHNKEFVNIFKSYNNIYLLISTLLAVNTMFTRKDIKNINIIKKEEFISMNKDINSAFLMDLYEKLKRNPLIIEGENYNENVYRRMSTLIKENVSKNSRFNLSINNENDSLDENDTLNELIIIENDYKEKHKDSFNLTKNLYNFNEQDKEILIKITKFHKFVGNDLKHEREFLVYDNYTKLIWGKNVEVNKDKGNLHTLNINEINDVFNGVEHSDVIKKYLENYPKEIKEKNHFITIITNKREINLKSNSLQTALLWYKALKSLVLKVKNENIMKNSENYNKINTKFKLKLQELWKEFILPKWNIYGNYILKKLKKKKNPKKYLSNKKTIKDIIDEIAEDKILEFNDFFRFYRIGLPQFCRGTIWSILIGNPCNITETLYENYLNKIEKVDFKAFDIRYHEEEKNIFNCDFNINQMIIDVIKEKDNFKNVLIKLKIEQEQMMIKSYNILRVFYLIRNDLIYKKSILPIIYSFLIVKGEEYDSFCDIYNLICNSDIIKFYTDDKAFIKKSLDFFNSLVEKNLPKIYNHFKNLEISHDLFFIPWITELFSESFDFKLFLRIIDLYLIDGEYILYQAGLTILAIQEDDLLDLTINEILNLVKRLPDKYDINIFLKKMRSYDMIISEYSKLKNEDELGAQKLQLFQAIFNDDN